MTKLLEGKKGIILGVANHHSIAWNIATKLSEAGAEIALTYQIDRIEEKVKTLAQEINCKHVIKCEATSEESIDSLFSALKSKWDKIDFIVHSIAFSNKEELQGRFIDTTRDNFLNTMDISCYTLAAIARKAEPYMTDGGSIITMTYFGAEKVVPNYNVMGVAKAALEASVRYLAADLGPKNIRVNAISAGPIKTLAASVIGDFKKMLDVNAANAPLKRNVSGQEVGGAALYLISNLSSGVTGEVHHVDGGYNIIGSPSL